MSEKKNIIKTSSDISKYEINNIYNKEQVIYKVTRVLEKTFLSNENQVKPIKNIDTGIYIEIWKSGIRETFGNDKYYMSLPTNIKTAKIASMSYLAKLIKYAKLKANNISNYPELSATLEGASLICEQMGEGEYFFYYPESAMHSISVTVPVGVDAYVSGIKLTEEWASRTEIDGELGALDDGGTGTLPRLSVWTVGNLFGEVEVEAKIGETEVALLSNEGGNYKFDTPAECKYTLTVILPTGAELFVNGKAIAANDKTSATAEDIAYGFTALGRYEVSELGVIEGGVPNFDKYTLTGYLAEPNVTAKLGGIELPLAGKSVSGYEMRCDFDYTAGDVFDAERIAAAEKFAESYLAYICGGGAWQDPANEKAFNDNYNAIKAQMIEGTAGYVGVMESYRDVNQMPKYDSFTVDSKTATDLVAYTEKSLSCRVEFSVTRTRTVEGVQQTDTLTGSISVLQVLYKGEWRVWSFVYSPAENSGQ